MRLFLSLLFAIAVHAQGIPLGSTGAVAGGGGTITWSGANGGSGCLVFSGASLTCATSSAPAIGDRIVFAVGYIGSTITNFADNCSGSSYSTNTATASGTSGANDGSFVAGANSACTLTITFAGAVSMATAVIQIAHGSTGTPVIDVQNQHQAQNPPGNGSNAVSSGSVTTSNSADNLFGWTVDTSGNGTMTVGTSFTSLVNNSSRSFAEYRVLSTTGSFAATWTTTSASDHFISGVIALHAP